MPQMELSVLERMVLFGVIPKEGDIFTMKQVRKLREEIAFSDDEREVLNFRPVVGDDGKPTGGLRWEEDQDPNKPVKFGPKMFVIVADALRKLNQEKKLTPQHVDLYEKFVEAEEKEENEKILTAAVEKVALEA